LNNWPKSFLPCKNIDHKIEVVFGLVPLFKALYGLNQKELKELKSQINDLFNRRYIKQKKLPYGALVLFVDKKDLRS
jgi:hypothetical protein